MLFINCFSWKNQRNMFWYPGQGVKEKNRQRRGKVKEQQSWFVFS